MATLEIPQKKMWESFLLVKLRVGQSQSLQLYFKKGVHYFGSIFLAFQCDYIYILFHDLAKGR